MFRHKTCCGWLIPAVSLQRRHKSTSKSAGAGESSRFTELHFPLDPATVDAMVARADAASGPVARAPQVVPSPAAKKRRQIFDSSKAVPVRAWVDNVSVDRESLRQIEAIARLHEVVRHPVAVMPDVHAAIGATVGTVIPCTQAIIPSAVGVDIGCGMVAARTSLTAAALAGLTATQLDSLRLAIEVAVPHGRTHNGRIADDAGGWREQIPPEVAAVWREHLEPEFKKLVAVRPELARTSNVNHLGTLGTGNHFIEVCEDEEQRLWVMLHSGSRGVGNKIGTLYIELAKKDMGTLLSNLPDESLAYFKEGTTHFDDYVDAVHWAQKYAHWNRELMLRATFRALRDSRLLPPFTVDTDRAINCHHNYVERASLEEFGMATPEGQGELGASGTTGHVWLTRKGATSARRGEYGIIPGSMGAQSYIVRGLGQTSSYCSCSHGAGRRFSRGEAKRRFTLDDHLAATEGVSCRKDVDVLDETPAAYKPIDDVMAAQDDLVEIVHTLRQRICVKG
jgi:tRNA-splicing ligase RtcB